jgi:hypothetical protein
MSSGPRVIKLEMPSVEGERVLFRWSEPDPSPWQAFGHFELVYPGIPLGAFSMELWVEIFMALQWRVFALHDGPVRVELPVTMPRASLTWWQGFHEAPQVDAAPLDDSRYSVWARGPVLGEERPVAVFFGAGKDSTLARSVLAEVYGDNAVLLVQMLHPFVRMGKERRQLRARQQSLMIDPALAGTRLAAAMVETDYITTFRPAGKVARPHTNLYTVPSLPVLLHRGVRLASMSNERSAYWCRAGGDAAATVGYAKSRPEVYAALGAHLAAVSDVAIEYGNTHFAISEVLSYKILLERYPAAFDRIVMCVVADTEHRWCGGCKKCAQYVHLGLLSGRRHADVDYERFWSQSKYVDKLLATAKEAPLDPATGNLRWSKEVSHSYHFASFCHTMSALRADPARRLVPASGRAVLDTLAAAWGNRTYDQVDWVSADATAMVDTAMARAVAGIYAQHAPVESGPFRDQPYMNTTVDYDFSVRTDRFGRPLNRDRAA